MSQSDKKYIIYELIFTLLALISVIFSFLDILGKIDIIHDTRFFIIDNIILLIFSIDYVYRLSKAPNKKIFIKNNIPDLIAIIPFSIIFRIFRMANFIRLVRLLKIIQLLRFVSVGSRLHKKIKNALNINQLNYTLWFTFIIILLGALGIYITEKDLTVKTFPDAIWWAFVTASTVGYGDISPSTQFGRVIAAMLMLTGIGTIGMVTGSISTYFITQRNHLFNDMDENGELEQFIRKSKELSNYEQEEVISYINYVKSKRKNK